MRLTSMQHRSTKCCKPLRKVCEPAR